MSFLLERIDYDVPSTPTDQTNIHGQLLQLSKNPATEFESAIALTGTINCPLNRAGCQSAILDAAYFHPFMRLFLFRVTHVAILHAVHGGFPSLAHPFTDRAVTCFFDNRTICHRLVATLIQSLVGAHAIRHLLIHVGHVFF